MSNFGGEACWNVQGSMALHNFDSVSQLSSRQAKMGSYMVARLDCYVGAGIYIVATLHCYIAEGGGLRLAQDALAV